jgi:hypothetical protein
MFTALVSVGLTAPIDGPFAITIRPVLWRLGVDVDIKLGRFHFHECWSAIPEPEPTTKPLTHGF